MKVIFLMASLALTSCDAETLLKLKNSNSNTAGVSQKFKIELKEGEVLLTHRILNGCSNDTCNYDFYNMVQSYGEGLPIEYGNDWGENQFDTELAGGEHGDIVSLGKTSCLDIRSDNDQYDRETQPKEWLLNSQFWVDLNYNGRSYLPAQEGHCYLMHKFDDRKKVIVLFHVKSLKKDDYVIIDEIETLVKEGGPY